jgi:DNA-directed RNA polymerase sigma subunit (sigma70/sigma32)
VVSSVTEDILTEDPYESAKDVERKKQIKKYITFLIDNSRLTSIQKKCIHLRFIEGIESNEEIGKMFDPPVSRQNIKQLLDRALHKIRQTAIGTGEK